MTILVSMAALLGMGLFVAGAVNFLESKHSLHPAYLYAAHAIVISRIGTALILAVADTCDKEVPIRLMQAHDLLHLPFVLSALFLMHRWGRTVGQKERLPL